MRSVSCSIARDLAAALSTRVDESQHGCAIADAGNDGEIKSLVAALKNAGAEFLATSAPAKFAESRSTAFAGALSRDIADVVANVARNASEVFSVADDRIQRGPLFRVVESSAALREALENQEDGADALEPDSTEQTFRLSNLHALPLEFDFGARHRAVTDVFEAKLDRSMRGARRPRSRHCKRATPRARPTRTIASWTQGKQVTPNRRRHREALRESHLDRDTAHRNPQSPHRLVHPGETLGRSALRLQRHCAATQYRTRHRQRLLVIEYRCRVRQRENPALIPGGEQREGHVAHGEPRSRMRRFDHCHCKCATSAKRNDCRFLNMRPGSTRTRQVMRRQKQNCAST
jgi:hypothetical protein